MRRHLLSVAVFAWALAGGFGCGAGGKLSMYSETDPLTMIEGNFDSGIYSFDDTGNITVLLFDGPVDRPARAMTMRMMWKPRVTRTPLDPDATNATIRYVVFSGDEKTTVGLYNGAGYLYPKGRLGSGHLTLSLWQGDLRWSEASDGFEDQLGQVRLRGDFSVHRDDKAMHEALRRLSVRLSRSLGYPQYVRADPVDSRQESWP